MAATLTEAEPSTEMPPHDSTRKSQPDASQLQDRFPDWFRTTPRSTLFVCLLGVAFTFFSLRPLWQTDLWSHLSYGRLIVENGSIPQTEPLQPLAAGVELIDTAWLSQVVGYATIANVGVSGIQFLYAASITFCLSLLAWRLHSRTRSVGITLLGLAALLWVEWQAFMIVRPQLGGLCCFTALFVWMTRRERSPADWVIVPVVMALWVNLHGSFLLGIVLLGTLCGGRAVDIWRRTGKLRRAFQDRRARRLFLLTEFAAAAVLLNPYGIDIFAAPFAISSHPNMADLVEWSPLTLRMRQGWAAFAVALLLAAALRFTPRRIPAAEALLLLGLGAGAMWWSRMLVWWAPVAVMSLGVHGHAIWRQRFKSRVETASSPKSRSLWTFASFGLAWIFFAFSPFGMHIIHGVEPPPERALSNETPYRAAAFLKKYPPRGLVFSWDQWGDYLGWKRPELKLFVNSHAHVVPRQVWKDYRNIEAGWAQGLDRYGVNTVVLSPFWQKALSRELETSGEWDLVFADDRSWIYYRKQPIGVEHPQ